MTSTSFWLYGLQVMAELGYNISEHNEPNNYIIVIWRMCANRNIAKE